MFTFKQLEAIYWIAELGSFAAAAKRLHTTQSAVSKRIHELESAMGLEVFDRGSSRQAHLTEKGEELYAIAARLLEQRSAAVEQLSRSGPAARKVRIGVTEITAVTWLPGLVQLMRKLHPNVQLELEVDSSANLRKQLASSAVEIVIVPAGDRGSDYHVRRVGALELAWMCRPGLMPHTKQLPQGALDSLTIFTQSEASSIARYLDPWFMEKRIVKTHIVPSNNLLSVLGLTIAGMGVGYLPLKALEPLLRSQALMVVPSLPRLPQVEFVAMWRQRPASALLATVARIATQACDFSHALNDAGLPKGRS